MYEKIKINRTKLKQGGSASTSTAQQQQLHKNVAELLETLGELKTEGSNCRRSGRAIPPGRELFPERAKTKALQDESTKPLNVHRWRKLPRQRPDRYRQVQRIRS